MNKIYINKSTITRQPNGFEFVWKLEDDFPYLEGHFPEKPILPAISMLDLVIESLEIYKAKNVSLKSIKSAKYTEIIEPGHELKFCLEHQGEQENWSAIILNNKTNKQVCIIKFKLN